MTEGLDGDDRYIMVEDEFEAVAKSFTQYLHHAEYIRLKKLARAQNASTINTISRPVDTITKMREETKRKKEAEAKATKQKDALHQMKAQAGRPQSDDEESDLDDDKADDPWIGTSLQGLMTSPKKSQTSLTGLGGIKSNTRAAAGYAKPEKKSLQAAIPFNLTPEEVPDVVRTSRAQVNEDATTSEDDDDLDAVVARRSASPTETPTRKIAAQLLYQAKYADSPPRTADSQFSEASITGHSSFISRLGPKSSNAPLTTSASSSKYNWKTPKSMFALDDDRPGRNTLAEEASQRMAKRMTELKTHKAREEPSANKESTKSDEIPIFLV